MSVRFLLAPTLELARNVDRPVLTVEAEYGSTVITGSLYTAAHHQAPPSPFSWRHLIANGRPSPCNDPAIPSLEAGDVLLSHVDLDTFGGCLRALPEWGLLFGREFDGFWALAEAIDVKGPHKLDAIAPSQVDRERLLAFWAWSETHRAPRERDRVHEVTSLVHEAGSALRLIFRGNDEMLRAGEELAARNSARNISSYRNVRSSTILRESAGFVNDLYTTPDGVEGAAVVAFNTTTKAITVSFADPLPGVSARAIVQELWGFEAGGHDGIAGSPRGREMTRDDLDAAYRATCDAVRDGLGRATVTMTRDELDLLLSEAGCAGHADGAGMGSHLGGALAHLESIGPRCDKIRRRRGLLPRF